MTVGTPMTRKSAGTIGTNGYGEKALQAVKNLSLMSENKI